MCGQGKISCRVSPPPVPYLSYHQEKMLSASPDICPVMEDVWWFLCLNNWTNTQIQSTLTLIRSYVPLIIILKLAYKVFLSFVERNERRPLWPLTAWCVLVSDEVRERQDGLETGVVSALVWFSLLFRVLLVGPHHTPLSLHQVLQLLLLRVIYGDTRSLQGQALAAVGRK